MRYKLFTLFFLLGVSSVSMAQLISLPKEARFKVGDDMVWASQSFDDSKWESKQLGTSCLSNEMKGDVYVWYRIKFLISSSIKALAITGNGIKINLGKIDDIDQTFFNGKMIGQTGDFPPAYKGKWDVARQYIISPEDVQWDKENCIAVRLFSPDVQGIGMYEGPYNFSPVQWSDFISTKLVIKETANNGFYSQVEFTSSKEFAFDGTVKYYVNDKNGKELFSESRSIVIEPGKELKSELRFSVYQPVKENIFKVGYRVTENYSTASVNDEQLYLAEKHLNIPVLNEPKPVVQNKIKDVFTSIAFKDQQQRGYLGMRMNKNLEERLLKIDEEGTLDGYLQRPGHHPWAGEHIGKYLETACNVWKNTGNEKLKLQMDRMMYELVNAQLPDGYLGTYSPDEYWTSWDVWSHKYNLYGLLACYTATGYQPALDACKKIGDLLCATFGNKPGQRDIILAGTHMGMAATSVLDPMVELYRYTGKKKYLDFCYYILDAWEQDNGPKIISRLLKTGNVKDVGNGKTYEMISNFTGLAKLYRVTGDNKLLKPLLIAWKNIADKKLYITGTASSKEYFQDDNQLPAESDDHIGEGCVTTTWIQFNKELFSITGDLKYAEQIERSIYNHLLAAENPETGCVSYYTPLMGQKPYTCYITCCQSSVPRGIAMIPYFTFGNIKNVPTVLMYEPASYKEIIRTADKKNVDLTLQIVSSFPENGNAYVLVDVSQNASFPIAFRVPAWCTNFVAMVGGKTYTGINNQNLVINRNWTSGEKINISFKIPIRTIDGGKNYPGQIAFQRGPQVLAFDEILNAAFLKNYQLMPNQKISVDYPSGINNYEALLPRQWIGKQAYSVSTSYTGFNSAIQQLVLVPFADASQTGGVVKLWLPLNVIK